MRNLLLTSALVVVAGAAFAQEAEEPEADTEAPAVVAPEAEPMEAEPAEGEAVDVEVVPAEDDATAEEPAEAETETVPVEVVPAEGEEPAMEAEPAEGEAEVLSPEAAQAIVREQSPNELRVDWITGTTITSPDGENVGTVQDLIVDGESSQVTAAIVGVGGFLGIGTKQIAVDFAELQIDYDAREISLELTRDEAEAAPEYAFREREEAPAPEGTVDPAMTTEPALVPAEPAPAPAD